MGKKYRKLNQKGFTLVELIAVIVLLAIVMSIGTVSVTSIIKNTREKNYRVLIDEINESVTNYYQECRFVNNNCESQITLGYLVENGYLSSSDHQDFKLENPLIQNTKEEPNKSNIMNCEISYEYSNGKVKVTAVNPSGSCPTDY